MSDLIFRDRSSDVWVVDGTPLRFWSQGAYVITLEGKYMDWCFFVAGKAGVRRGL